MQKQLSLISLVLVFSFPALADQGYLRSGLDKISSIFSTETASKKEILNVGQNLKKLFFIFSRDNVRPALSESSTKVSDMVKGAIEKAQQHPKLCCGIAAGVAVSALGYFAYSKCLSKKPSVQNS